MTNFTTIIGYLPGLIGRVTELHAKYYAENWNFGPFFEGKVAIELSGLVTNYNNSRDRIWSLVIDGLIEGSITIDGSSEKENTAHLRWFIISEKLRGTGAGNFLMEQALSFCRDAEFDRVYLWTFQGLSSARHIYEKFGFLMTEERPGDHWGTFVREQRFDLVLK
ncbi:MAG: GNAT family N-acetyltransferase [Firmicutes bacterium HGW-Firmicutes-12]|jgi:GNAT superfamily N-acetyltransferase|nr:MAG: GNAT family N-acetyltransferase [Firmicutes bacterium HGW-Firmicutes-12]